MTRMPAKTNPKPASTRCSIDHLANQASKAVHRVWVGGGASTGPGGTGPDKGGAAGGVDEGRSCVADSMPILPTKRRKYSENLTNSTLADVALQAIFQKNPELRALE